MPLLIALALATAAGANGAPVPSGHAAKLKSCPQPKNPTTEIPRNLQVRGVSCSAAFALGMKVIARAPKGCLVHTDATHIRLSQPCRIGGYRCTGRSIVDGRVVEATCRRGTKFARFQVQYLAR